MNNNSFAKIIGVVLLTIIIVCLSGCPMKSYYKSPGQQNDTQWISDDGRFLINTDDRGVCYGIIDVHGQKIPVGISFGGHTNVDLIGVFDEEWTSKIIETWTCNDYYDSYCTVYVKAENGNSFFGYKNGDKLKFKKLDEEEKVDFNLSDYDETDYVNNIHVIASALNDELYSEKDFEWHTKEYDSIVIAIELISKDVGRIVKVNPVSLSNEEFSLNIIDDNSQEFEVVYDRQANEVKRILN